MERNELAADQTTITRDFGLMLSDFTRIFPRVWPDARRIDDATVSVDLEPTGRVTVTLSEQKFRRLATLRIPYLDIIFDFEATTEEQRAEFFEDFERSFQKGGG